MSKRTNCTKNGVDYYKINRKVGKKINKNGELVSEMKTFYGHSKKEAEEKYHRFLASRKENDSPILKKPFYLVLDNWIEVFFNHYDLADTTKKRYTNAYSLHLRDVPIAKYPLENVNSMLLQDFYNKSEVKYSSLNSLHKLLRLFYKHCELNGICSDITRAVTVPKKIHLILLSMK